MRGLSSPPSNSTTTTGRRGSRRSPAHGACSRRPACPTPHHIAVGHVADTILRLASERGFDKIVMSTHGHTGLLHLLLGSIAEEVLKRSRIPVTLVKPPAAG